jgi:hypothetical protein
MVILLEHLTKKMNSSLIVKVAAEIWFRTNSNQRRVLSTDAQSRGKSTHTRGL